MVKVEKEKFIIFLYLYTQNSFTCIRIHLGVVLIKTEPVFVQFKPIIDLF